MRKASVVSLFVALVVVAFAVPAVASANPTTLRATLSGDGDPDGSGSALLQIDKDKNTGVVCHQIHVENVTTPITGGAITVGESGEIVARLAITDPGQDLEGCTGQLGIRNRELNRITKDPSGYVLHLYNEEFPCDIFGPDLTCPPGAVRGQLQGVS
jgi:hypothetical protein